MILDRRAILKAGVSASALAILSSEAESKGVFLLVFGKSRIPVPVGFNRWTPSFSFFRNGTAISTDFDITMLLIAGATVWYLDPINGNDATGIVNDRTHPLQKLSTAALKAGVTQIRVINLAADYIARGTFAWNNSQIGQSCSVVVEGNFRFISCHTASSSVSTWSKTAGQTNTYQTASTVANAGSVIDFKFKSRPFYMSVNGSGQAINGLGYAVNDTVTLANGAILTVIAIGAGGSLANWSVTKPAITLVSPGPTAITSTSGIGTGAAFTSAPSTTPAMWATANHVLSIAAVDATPNSFFCDGTNVYVNTTDSRSLVGDVLIQALAASNNGRIDNNVSNNTLYVQGIDFVGGLPFDGILASSLITGCVLAFNNCSFQASGWLSTAGPNGLSIGGFMSVYLYQCGAYYNCSDGLNKHSFEGNGTTPGTSPNWFENECCTMGNGTTGSTNPSDNETTSHDFCNGIQLNGIYIGSDDRVNGHTDSAYLWSLGTYTGQAIKIVTGSESVCAQISAKIWMDTCTIVTGANNQVAVEAAAFMGIHNMATPSNSGPTAVTPY